MSENRWFVFPVAAAAYGKRSQLYRNASLTHAYNPALEKVLCGKVKPRSILDDYALVDEEPPTCELCAKRLAKLHAKGLRDPAKKANTRKPIFPCDILLNLARFPAVMIPITPKAARYVTKLFGAPDKKAPEAGGRVAYSYARKDSHTLMRALTKHGFEVHFR